MKFKVRQALKKLQAIILVAAMVITLLPAVNLQQAEAGIASGAKTINYGAKVFTNPDLNESFDESEPGRWGMLYFANQKWRVLNVNENSLFILLNAAATGDVVFGETPGWTTSPVRTWLNGDYYTDSFTNAEKALIMDTSIEGASDKLFALSYDEANNASYGFDRDRARLIRGAYQYGWWLRTAGDLAGAQRAVEGLGKLVEYPSTSAKAAVRPACNLNISNIFMTSTISGGKSAATVGGGFVPVSDVTDKATEWKMTLIDNSKPSITINRVTRGNPTDSSRINDVKIEYSCTDPNTADNKYVSAVITDANDNIISYAKLGAYTPGEGTVDFNVDSEFDENGYKLVLFTEEASDGTLTDIASTPVNASVPPKVVERVLVDPEYTSVDAGQSVSYTAKVVGAGADAEGNGGYLPLQEVDWAIENNNSAATNWEWDVDDDHPNRIKVNIAANETSDEIRVIAISAEDPSVEGVGLINPFMVLKYDLEGGTYNGSTVIADVTNLTSQTIIGGTQAATAAVILPDPENGDLKKDNATFRGWFTEIGGEGDEFSNSNPKNLPQSMTLHAAWSTNMGKGDFLVSKIEDQVYTGRAIKPVVRVMHGQTELKQGVDYNVSYTNNTKVAKQTDGNPPTITVIGRGNYRESEVVKFSIVAKDINSSDISMTIQDKKYNKGNPVSSDPVIKMGKKSLAKDRDYKVIYDKIGGSSTASTKVPVTIQGIGNFTGTINTQFYIVPESKMMSAKGIKIEVPKTEYTGSAVEPTVVVKDGSQTVDPSEYTLTFNNNVKVGKGSVTVTGNGITYAGSKTVNFDITPKTLGDGTIPAATIKISGIPEQQFSADKVYPFETEDEFTVYDEAGKQFLTKNVDYTIEYKGNDKLGKATATLKGKGNYTGSFVKEFTIVACEMINDNLSYQISSAAYNNGAAVTPKIKIMDGSKVLKINKDYTVECRNNTKVTESAHAVITGKGNYTGEIIKDFRIYTLKDVSELNISILKDGEYEYNGTALIPQIAVVDEERRVELEEGIDYTVKASKNINAGQAVAEIKGIGTYRGSVKKNFTINPMPIASSEVNLVMSNQKVTSLNTAPKQNLALSMMVDGKVKNLKLGVDYVIDKWSDSTSTMKNAQLLLKGKGNFSGERQVTYDIFKVDISKRVTISRVAAHTYTGTQICPEITVACGNHILNKDEEYHVTYGENTKVGLGTITVTAMGETYGGSKTMTFPILPKWLSWIVDKDDPVTVPGNGGTKPIGISENGISDNGISGNDLNADQEVPAETLMITLPDKIVAGEEYNTIEVNCEAAYWSIEGATSADTKIEMIGTGRTAKLFVAEDEEAEQIKLIVKNADNLSQYGTKEVKPTRVVHFDLTGGTSGTIDPINPTYEVPSYGTLTIPTSTEEGKNNPERDGYNFMGFYTEKSGQGTKFENDETIITKNCTYYAAWASTREGSYTIIDIGERTYTGSPITPIVSVYDGDKKLTLNKDYKLSYKNNIAVGDASGACAPQVIVTGMRNYTKTEICKFSIVGKDLSDEDVSITVADGVYNNGKDVVSLPVVIVNGKKLNQNLDYLVDISNPEDLGAKPEEGTSGIEIEMIIKGIGSYSGSVDASYRIMQKQNLLSDASIKVTKPMPVEYEGSRITAPKFVVKDNYGQGGELIPYDGTNSSSADYSIEFLTDNMNVGKVKVRLVGMNKYAGYKESDFNIVKANLKNATIEPILPQAFVKNGVVLEGRSLKVVYEKNENTMILREGVDFKTTYSNNKAVTKDGDKKVPTVKVTGIGNFTGKNSATFAIVGKNAYKLNVTVKDAKAKYYNGAYIKVKPQVIVKDGKVALSQNTDYTISYYNNTNPKESTEENAPYVIITGKGNYFGNTPQYQFSIVESKKIDSNAITIDPLEDYYYTGEQIKPLPVITDTARKDPNGDPLVLELGVDYTLSYASNKNKAKPSTNEKGKLTPESPRITIRGKGVYSGSRIQPFEIKGKQVTESMVTFGDSYYNSKNGKAATPIVTVTDIINGKERKLKGGGKDYSVSAVTVINPPTDTDPGNGTISVKGTNNYSSEAKEFRVKLYTQKLSSTTTSAIPAQVYSGSQIKPSIKVFYSGKELVENDDYSITYGENIKAGKGLIILKGKEDSLYGGTKIVTFKILPKWLSWIVR